METSEKPQECGRGKRIGEANDDKEEGTNLLRMVQLCHMSLELPTSGFKSREFANQQWCKRKFTEAREGQ